MKPIGEIFLSAYYGSVPTVPRRTILKCDGAAYSSATYSVLYGKLNNAANLPNIADITSGVVGYFIVAKWGSFKKLKLKKLLMVRSDFINLNTYHITFWLINYLIFNYYNLNLFFSYHP